jgi:hypothetical protein
VLTENNAKFRWEEAEQRAFDTLRTNLSINTKLMLPDFSKPFILACDASNVALGAVLSQIDDEGREHPVSFASRVLSKTERNWGVGERETFAAVWAMNHYRSFLLPAQFTLITDHKPLLWLRIMKNPSSKFMRWALQLEEFNYKIQYKEGRKNCNADAMSRLPEEDPDNTVCPILIELESIMTNEDIKKAQNEDENIQKIIQAVIKNDWSEVNLNSSTMQAFATQREGLFVEEDLLYLLESAENCKIILPPKLHHKVLQICHNAPTAGHLGVWRTLANINEYCYYPGMRKIVADYICRCLDCEKFKPPAENTKALLQPIITHAPWEMIEIDFIGPLPETKNSNRYILSVIDHFSKFAVAYATPRQTATAVTDSLTRLFSEFGVPQKILTDNGRCFTSQVFMDFCILWGVNKRFSTSYHPATNGLVERFNGTLTRILKRYTTEEQNTWDVNLPLATYAYNISKQRVNKVSPYEVVFGRKATTPLSDLVRPEKIKITTDEYVKNIQRNSARIQELVNKCQESEREKSKARYDAQARGQCFRVGDCVLLYNPAVKLGQNRKFSPPYGGPWMIIEQIGETNFKIQHVGDSTKVQTVHQNRLKRFRRDNQTASKIQTTTQLSSLKAPHYGNEDSEEENTKDKTDDDDFEPEEQDPRLDLFFEETADIVRMEKQQQTETVATPIRQHNNKESDPNYTPTTEVSFVPSRRNPQRQHNKPARYDAEDYDVNMTAMTQERPTSAQQARRAPGPWMPTWLTLLLFVMLIASNPVYASKRTALQKENLANYFGPAHVCGGRAAKSTLFELPSPPTCEWKDPREKTVEPIMITPYFKMSLSDPVEAYACEVEVSKITTFLGFWGKKSILERALEYRPLDLLACKVEVYRIIHHATSLQQLTADLFSDETDPHLPQYEWCCKNKEVTRYRVRIRKQKIRFNFNTNKVVSSANPSEECTIDAGHCFLSTATLVWDNHDKPMCTLREGRTVTGEISKENWTWSALSDEGQLAVSGRFNEEYHCGKTLYPSDQGMFIFFCNVTGQNDTDAIKIESTDSVGILQYITRKLEDLSYRLFRKNWESICVLQQQRYYWLKQLMASENTAYIAARILLKANNVYGHMSGQFLQIHECFEINEYYLNTDTPNDTTTKGNPKCTLTIPVSYGRSQQFQGLWVPATNDIKKIDAQIACNQFYNEYVKDLNGNIYEWDGMHFTFAGATEYKTLSLMEAAPNKSYLHLMAGNIYDHTAKDMDALLENTQGMSQAILSLLRATRADVVSFNPNTISNAASDTVSAMHDAVSDVLDQIDPLFRWAKIIVLSIVSIFCVSILLIAICKIRLFFKKQNSERLLANLLRARASNHNAEQDDAMEMDNMDAQ